jgi:N-acetylmuramoyl-L-alanine amidase
MYKVFLKIIVFVICSGWFLYASPALSQSASAKSTVIIDPAHGGADSGVKISDKIHEKDITLKLALLVQKELSKLGNIQVLLTRDKDVDISMQERINRITTIQPRVMISIHINAGFYKTAKGFEMYFPGFKTTKSAKDSPSAIISDMKKNKNLNESVRLAQNIQKQLESVFPKESRGLREAPLPLLEGITIPAVIVEIGFSGNAENRKKLNDEKYQQDIARALSKGIRESL